MLAQDQQSKFEAMFQAMIEGDNAALYESSTGNNTNYRILTLALDTAKLAGNSFKIGFPFRSFVVISATDTQTNVNMRLEGEDSQFDSIPLKLNNSLVLPFPVKQAFIDWSAQSGKTITIMFFVRGAFATNTLVQTTSGGVSISEGSAVTSVAGAQSTSTAAALFAADSTRIKMIIQNQSSIPIYLGDSAVTVQGGAKPGIQVLPGGVFEWMSTAACYVVSGSSTGATDISLTKFA